MELPRDIELADRNGRAIERGLRDAIVSAVRKLKRRFQLLQDPHMAYDIAHEAAEKLSGRIADSGRPRNVSPYAYITVRNLVLSCARRQRRIVGLEEAQEQVVLPQAEANILVREVLDQLSAQERQIIVLTYQGLKSAEIAAVVHTTVSNVDSIRSRVRARLRADVLGTSRGSGGGTPLP